MSGDAEKLRISFDSGTLLVEGLPENDPRGTTASLPPDNASRRTTKTPSGGAASTTRNRRVIRSPQYCQGNGDQSGSRFSRNASRPSTASSVP